jgi:hypothetical protein
MIDRDNIQIAELCPIQFADAEETRYYKQQLEYTPKVMQGVKIQCLISEDLMNDDDMQLEVKDENGRILVDSFHCDWSELSEGIYYCNMEIDSERFSEIPNTCGYFYIKNGDTILAKSVLYEFNPTYTEDLKFISYTHSENDYSVIFDEPFTIWVECGFKPQDTDDNQDVEEFMEQNLTNELVYADEYEVNVLTIGGGKGIPHWLKKKISRASLLDTFMINNVEYKRIQGSKMEKIEDTREGLATYRLSLQKTINYLQ